MNCNTSRYKFLLCALLGFVVSLQPAYAQQATWQLDTDVTTSSWTAFTKAVEEKYTVRFFYDEAIISTIQLDKINEPISLEAYLKQSLNTQQLFVAIDKNGNVFITSNNELTTILDDDIYQSIEQTLATDETNNAENNSAFLETTKEHVAKLIVIGNRKDGLKEDKVVLSGYMRTQGTDEEIIGGTIIVQETGTGTASDENGFYNLYLDKGVNTLVLSDLNHADTKVKVDIRSSGNYNFELESKTITLDDVVVTSDKYNAVKGTKMGFEVLKAADVKEIPLVLGERDILKISTLLPGIQSVGEGSSGFNVRGSPADQNLFYIDEVPVYNTSHLFGFFSAFNSDAISEFSLSKSNIPAKFGGRLASIFDITALEGNMQDYKLRGGISPITGRVLAEGPLQKDKSSFMLGLRSTYSDWILKLVDNPDYNNTTAFFGDVLGKLSFRLSEKTKLNAFGYYSTDDIDFAERTKFDTNNAGASLSLSHFLNEKNNINFSLVYSRYGLNVENTEQPIQSYQQSNILEHKEAKLGLTLRPNEQHIISVGANAVLYQIDRGDFLPVGDLSLIKEQNLGKEKGIESGIFVSEEWNPSPKFSLNAGLRYNLYTYLGPQSIFEYQAEEVKTIDSIIDTLSFGENEAISTYTGLDYRLGAKYSINTNWAIKASYNKLHQYIFLLSNTIALAPTDKWKLTDYHTKPMEGQQFSVGVYTNIFRKKFEFSVETYYKNVDNLVEYKDGADLVVNEFPEWDILQGDLNAYGVEVMLKKPKGRFNGWLNYTYSKSTVLVDNGSLGQINFGQSYPANYDKPHSLNLVTNYKFKRRFSMSANVVYSTGRPITYPTTIYFQNDLQLINYASRNAYRIPDYFRVDLSAKIEGNLKAKKLLHGTWVFSVYNLTGRANAYNVYFKSQFGSLRGYKVSIFARPIFSVTYNFKFGNYES